MQPLQALTMGEALRELLHDAEEALIGGFDPVSPLKPHLGPAFKAVSDRLRFAIDARYRPIPWTSEDYVLHKRADRLAAASEAFHVTGWSRDEIRESLGINLNPVETDSLPVLEGMRPWEPWPPRLAAALFLGKLRELLRADADLEDAGGLEAVVEHENAISSLAASFYRLSPSHRRKCRVALTGSSLSDTYVYAEAHDGSQHAEGVVVDGERDAAGQWDFDTAFTIFTTDEELVVCHGYNCHVEVQ